MKPLFTFRFTCASIFITLLKSQLQGQLILVNFEGRAGMANNPAVSAPPGGFVAPEWRLSEQLLASHGVVFTSGSTAPYVAVVNVLGANQLPSGTNAIGGVNSSLGLDYREPIDIAFYVPGDKTHPAETDFISIKSDLEPLGSGTVTCEAFDYTGRLLRRITEVDNHAITFTLSQPRIHRIRLTQSNGSVAFDDLSFAPPVAVDDRPILTIDVSQVRLCSELRTNKTYQLQFRSALTTNTWVDLGSPIVGNGTTNCVTEPVTDPQRYYRLSVLP